MAQPNSVAFAGLPAEYSNPRAAVSPEAAREYCARLARSHYENFSVATWFLPQRLRQHFYNVYSYCRIADDLADEVGDAQESLRLLDEWERELDACYAGAPRHPVFVALAETITHFDIPRQPFADLLTAFRQDQQVMRYSSFADLLAYCHYSANPVGRLVLYVCGYRDPERQALSDYTCTALQLANFWQDVVPDYGKGRLYLPLEDLERFKVPETQIAKRQSTPEFRALMKFEVDRARAWFERGLPLAGSVDAELALDLELFTRGGQEILRAIERLGYDVLRRRPSLSKSRKLLLLARAIVRKSRNG
ncbi:MAG: squalene synthase HpnC [Candidatus Korobacteraceae bacterium]